MTVENCIKLLEAYKKQSENPVSDVGTPYTGKQRTHAMARSKRNYHNMALRILSSRKFTGGQIKVRTRAGVPNIRTFEEHPIVTKLKKEFGLIKEKPKEVKKVGSNTKQSKG